MLASCLELLSWDELTYMPHGGVTFRARQTAYLAGLLHAQSTDPRLGECLAAAEASDLVADPHGVTAVNLRRWRWSYDRLSRVPRGLVEELADVTTVAQQVWADARSQSAFEDFLPWLERVLSLKRDEASHLAAGGDLYDALLEDYEPGATSSELQRLFDALRAELSPLMAEYRTSLHPPARVLAGRQFEIDRQQGLTEQVAAALGFDFNRGRIDTTAHPFFSPIGPGDCRITTRYSEHDFCEGFFSVLHEVGHALYEQGIATEYHGTPQGEAPSLGLHESQSRLWENGVGRSRAFWECFYPQAQALFPDALGDVPLRDFVAEINAVHPGCNRVRADRVTYDLHIMVRFELERALIQGDLRAAELPGAWNERYRKDLGVSPPNDAEGCLQDGHWSAGQFGYFPTYSLGNVYAAQLLEAARRALPNLDVLFARGEFEPLREWLAQQVYGHGQRFTAMELIAEATGEPPSIRPLVESLRNGPLAGRVAG